MLKYVLLAIFAGLAWFVFVDGSKLDEDDVRAYYAAGRDATLALDADAVCGMLAKDLSGRATSYIGPREQIRLVSRDQACRETEALFRQMKPLMELLGNDIPFGYTYEINKITLSEDRKTAKVEVRSVLDIVGMRFVSRSVDTLVRDRRVVLTRHTEGRVWVSESPGM
ncbi:hypothetical protein N799_10395 [Lysobacter arseniciresistens ZS79]|uniref:Uncharacterized protein n=1 Tax=Lysobacter arseniciresistens ZS79 TaxID=913325 RepID=A0A0A0F3Z3_9GAMM|nr:hypothetical protein [Lysobacter arseniciresistens]KGM57235.1 hypothetical protein N799_10395 [Lysobacter arseniciresistens ZS79]